MLLNKLLSLLELFVGEFLSAEFLSVQFSVGAIGGGGAGQSSSSEIELPVGDIGGSRFFELFREFSRWVTSAGSSSLEIVELHSDVTVRLEFGRSEKNKSEVN
jgi:hypothetical protein